MSDKVSGSGSCLCGAISIKAEKIAKNIGACHCSMCRNWSGGPLLAVDCGNAVSFEGEEDITIFASSDWAERGFCKKCGTHLFYRLKATGQFILPVGLLDLPSDDLTFDHQVFIDEKPSYYSFAENTENLTGAEIFAKYAPDK